MSILVTFSTEVRNDFRFQTLAEARKLTTTTIMKKSVKRGQLWKFQVKVIHKIVLGSFSAIYSCKARRHKCTSAYYIYSDDTTSSTVRVIWTWSHLLPITMDYMAMIQPDKNTNEYQNKTLTRVPQVTLYSASHILRSFSIGE